MATQGEDGGAAGAPGGPGDPDDLGGFYVRSSKRPTSTGRDPAAAGMPAARTSYGRADLDGLQLRRLDEPASVTQGAIGEAWEHFKSSPVSMVFVFLVPDSVAVLDYFAKDLIGKTLGASEETRTAAIVALAGVQLVSTLLQNVLTAGTVVFWLKTIRGQGASVGDVFAGFRFAVPVVVTSLLSGLMVLAGTVALVVPGIILGMGYAFAMYVVVDKNIGYVDALRASWRITSGRKLDIFVLLILAGLVNMLGMVACCVGVLATVPITAGAIAIAYDRAAEPGNAYLEG